MTKLTHNNFLKKILIFVKEERHSELGSESSKKKMLKQVQHDKKKIATQN